MAEPSQRHSATILLAVNDVGIEGRSIVRLLSPRGPIESYGGLRDRHGSVAWILVGVLITAVVAFVLYSFVGAIVVGIFSTMRHGRSTDG